MNGLKMVRGGECHLILSTTLGFLTGHAVVSSTEDVGGASFLKVTEGVSVTSCGTPSDTAGRSKEVRSEERREEE